MGTHHGTSSVRAGKGFVDRSRISRHPRVVIVCYVLFVLLSVTRHSLPIVSPSLKNASNTAISTTMVFLTKYGYLPDSDGSSGNLRTEFQLRQAVAEMQRFGGLPPTGDIDEDTLRLMGSRRCGVPDILPGHSGRVKRYAIQGQKWPGTNITWSVKRNVSDTDEGMVRSQLRKAFAVWSSASTLHFTEVEGLSADILVSFLKGHHGDGYPFDGEGAVLAHAFFPGEGIGGDAHFDAEEKWLSSHPDREDQGVNLFAVAAHEIGHSLGLSHSSTPGSLMFPYYQMMGNHFSLPKDDADGIRHIYGYQNTKKQHTFPTVAPSMPTSSGGTIMTTDFLPSSTKESSPLPDLQDVDICNASIDAISIIRRELFIFKGRYFWRSDANGTIRAGYPVTIDRFWGDLPETIDKIDAVYERPSDTKIVFFSGKQFWLFSANVLEAGYPKPLVALGLPEDLERVDAALVWGYNGQTYLFSGKEYWRLDEGEARVELDYPRSIEWWRGVPHSPDAALQWTDGNSYFFKGTKFWQFNDIKMRTEKRSPSNIGDTWFKCVNSSDEVTSPAAITTTVMSPTEEPSKPNSGLLSQVPNTDLIFSMTLFTFSLHSLFCVKHIYMYFS